jgi:hypothetical protein
MYPYLDSFSQLPMSLHPSSSNPSKPYLLWIDSEQNDPTTAAKIHQIYPLLDIHFTPTYAEACSFLYMNECHLEQLDKFLVICKRFYVHEEKSLMDVTSLFDKLELTRVPICVYPGSRTKLPNGLRITTRQIVLAHQADKVLDFIRQNLNS